MLEKGVVALEKGVFALEKGVFALETGVSLLVHLLVVQPDRRVVLGRGPLILRQALHAPQPRLCQAFAPRSDSVRPVSRWRCNQVSQRHSAV